MELKHHGIKGQRWGVRRYQNADGSLTPLGKKKYGTKENFEKQMAAKNFRKQSKKFSKMENNKPKKTAKDMTDDELISRINRLKNEKLYLEINRDIASLTPKKQSKGQAFVKTIGKDVLSPVAKNIGKQYLEKALKKKLGIDVKDSLEGLEKEIKKLKFKSQFAEYKNATSPEAMFVKNWNAHKRYKKAVSEYEKEYGKQQVDDFVDTTATDAGKDYVSKALAAISK